MNWIQAAKGYELYLRLEKGLSDNSIKAYLADLNKLRLYIQESHGELSIGKIDYPVLTEFIAFETEKKSSPYTRARLISGLRSFFQYLGIEKHIDTNPTDLLESPRLGRKLPDYLSLEEIDAMISCIDLSKPFSHRNKTMLEVLYSCGLRVSELIGMEIYDVMFDDDLVRVTGKGDKQRLVPVNKYTLKLIKLYLSDERRHIKTAKGEENILFLNRFGKRLSRVSVFNLVKELAQQAGIKKDVSPHTFRHSFATHLVENGADLRSVQEMLGHESITTTEIYTHLKHKSLRDAVLAFHPRNKSN